MELKQKLKELRASRRLSVCATVRRLTQEEVAEALGVSAQTVSKWERGLLSPDISLLPKIALLYRCSIDSLFDYKTAIAGSPHTTILARLPPSGDFVTTICLSIRPFSSETCEIIPTRRFPSASP